MCLSRNIVKENVPGVLADFMPAGMLIVCNTFVMFVLSEKKGKSVVACFDI